MSTPSAFPLTLAQIFESLENVTGAVVYCGHAIDPNHGDQQVSYVGDLLLRVCLRKVLHLLARARAPACGLACVALRLPSYRTFYIYFVFVLSVEGPVNAP